MIPIEKYDQKGSDKKTMSNEVEAFLNIFMHLCTRFKQCIKLGGE